MMKLSRILLALFCVAWMSTSSYGFSCQNKNIINNSNSTWLFVFVAGQGNVYVSGCGNGNCSTSANGTAVCSIPPGANCSLSYTMTDGYTSGNLAITDGNGYTVNTMSYSNNFVNECPDVYGPSCPGLTWGNGWFTINSSSWGCNSKAKR